MPSSTSMLGGPPELQDAIKDYFSYNVLPTCGVFQLLSLAHQGHGDYTWGFRIYRTTYQAGSDPDFARAIEILNQWIRHECFSYTKDDRLQIGSEPRPPLDGKANGQLSQRLRHDIIEDQQLLEGATPDKILKLAQDWVHYDQKAKTGDSPRYRFFLVIDDEVINHLLQLNLLELSSRRSLQAAYSIKVFDARFNSPAEFSGDEADSDSDSDAVSDADEDEDVGENPNDPMYGYEGWFWASASKLAFLWFCEHWADEELITIDRSWDNVKRFVHCTTAMNKLPFSIQAQPGDA